MVPVVYLRIDAPRSHWQDLLQLLADRSAQSKQADLQRRRVVVRAEMELSRSMGVTRQIGEVTDGAAQVLSWLMRYQPAGVSEGLPPSPLGRGPG
jgi:translation elongation factor EF-G